MIDPFAEIPEVVIDYVRRIFAAANDKVTRTMSVHPSMHEESLDHILVMELSSTPPAFFAREQVGVSLESHWLGGRHMFDRWEIADIAFFVILRRAGHLIARKVALLQTKRLYSKEIPVAPIDPFDYRIGIGRLVDRTDPQVPMTRQRRFRFDGQCTYAAMTAGHEQVQRIDRYEESRGIPVYYGFYNPLAIPYDADYPASDGSQPGAPNEIGMRVQTSRIVHATLASLDAGRAPTFDGLTTSQLASNDAASAQGWRIENFIADEVLRCRQGRRFDSTIDERLSDLLYRRSAPIAAAITMTIDVGGSP
ncbi:hypothetical protein VOM14_17990 [Paraburkholderia sp. MPAMCS5]|uniref:hypothetical protein n=1 Tax=Paraburkholderia sp. MPAMCS5 TaxID=3112563 RepID=UPI002E17A89F|nr:hypothetical protein [Paraburkholderia sp. MPAMCS5]